MYILAPGPTVQPPLSAPGYSQSRLCFNGFCPKNLHGRGYLFGKRVIAASDCPSALVAPPSRLNRSNSKLFPSSLAIITFSAYFWEARKGGRCGLRPKTRSRVAGGESAVSYFSLPRKNVASENLRPIAVNLQVTTGLCGGSFPLCVPDGADQSFGSSPPSPK